MIEGLEGEHLPALLERRLEFAKRRARARRHHQLLRIVVGDAGQCAQIELRSGQGAGAHGALRAAAAHLEARASGRRRRDDVAHLRRRPRRDGCVSRLHGQASSLIAQKRGSSGNGRAPACTCMRPSSAQLCAAFREHLAGIEQQTRVEGALDPLLLRKVRLAEHRAHQIRASRRRCRAPRRARLPSPRRCAGSRRRTPPPDPDRPAGSRRRE